MTGGRDRKTGRTHQHLLNFSVGGGDDYHYSDAPRRPSGVSKQRRSDGGGGGASHEGYLLSNFRVGVRASAMGQLSRCVRVNDAMLGWDLVDQVVMWGDFEEHRCPICIDQPRAARVTVCGHVFCLPCLLQYREQQREAKKPFVCPLCQHSISLSNLKMVSIIPTRTHAEGDTLILTLVKRWREGVLCFAGPDPVLRSNDPPPALSESSRFSRYFMLTQADVLDLISRDMAELQQSLETALDEGDETETVLLQEAVTILQEHCEKVASGEEPNPRATPAQGDREYGTQQLVLNYQAADGQYYFLSPFCMRMLSHHAALLAGAVSDAEPASPASPTEPMQQMPPGYYPGEIEAKIEHVERHTMNEAAAKRYRYAAYLPYATSFSVIDVDLAGVVCEATMAKFKEEIAARRQRWADEQRRIRAEEKRAQLIRRKEDAERRARGSGFFEFSQGTSSASFHDPSLDGPPPSLDDLEAYPGLPGAAFPDTPPEGDDVAAELLEGVEGVEPAALPPPPSVSTVEVTERRIDPSNGKGYTKQDFMEFYGNLEEWNAATETTPLVKTASLAQIQAEEREQARYHAATARAGSSGAVWGSRTAPKSEAQGSKESFSVLDRVAEPARSPASQPAGGTAGKGKKKSKGVKISLNTGRIVK